MDMVKQPASQPSEQFALPLPSTTLAACLLHRINGYWSRARNQRLPWMVKCETEREKSPSTSRSHSSCRRGKGSGVHVGIVGCFLECLFACCAVGCVVLGKLPTTIYLLA